MEKVKMRKDVEYQIKPDDYPELFQLSSIGKEEADKNEDSLGIMLEMWQRDRIFISFPFWADKSCIIMRTPGGERQRVDIKPGVRNKYFVILDNIKK